MSKAQTAEPGMLGGRGHGVNTSTHPPHPPPCTEGSQPSLGVSVGHKRVRPVGRCGEDGQHHGAPVQLQDVRHGLDDVEVEVRVARHGAVEPGLEEGGPLLLQHPLRAPHVVLAHPGHPGHHHLRGGHPSPPVPTPEDRPFVPVPTPGVSGHRGDISHLLQVVELHGDLPEEEVDVAPPFHGVHEVGLCGDSGGVRDVPGRCQRGWRRAPRATRWAPHHRRHL